MVIERDRFHAATTTTTTTRVLCIVGVAGFAKHDNNYPQAVKILHVHIAFKEVSSQCHLWLSLAKAHRLEVQVLSLETLGISISLRSTKLDSKVQKPISYKIDSCVQFKQP